MLLSELFNTTASFEVIKDSDHTFEVQTQLKKSVIIFTALTTGIAERGDSKNDWDVAFSSHDPTAKIGAYEFALTGNHESVQVLAFVREAMHQLIKKHDPSIITFSSKNDRAEIYKKMIDRFASQYKCEVNKNSGTTYFKMIRK
jgi:hypothetical protein